MEKQLENKIAEAFHKKDESFNYEKKDELWQRITGHINGRRGVAAFWRVAAILLALIAFGGAFAAISVSNKHTENIAKNENQIKELQLVIDSLQSIKPEKIKEIITVEKEKIVYREIEKPQANLKATIVSVQQDDLEIEIENLEELLSMSAKKLQLTRDSLELALASIESLQLEKSQTNSEKSSSFKLKTERAENQMQPVKTDVTPKMKIQLFKIQNDNIKYDTNTTLLKK